MCATRKRAPLLRHHEGTFLSFFYFSCFVDFSFALKCTMRKRGERQRAPLTRHCEGTFLPRRGAIPKWQGVVGGTPTLLLGFMFVIFVRFEVFPFLWPQVLKLFRNLIWNIFFLHMIERIQILLPHFLLLGLWLFGVLSLSQIFFIFWGVLEVWFRYHNLSLLLPANGPFLSPLVQLWLHTYHPLPCKMALVENLSEKDMNLPCKMGWVYLLLKGTSIWEPWFATGERKSRPVSDIELWSHKKALIWWWSKKRLRDESSDEVDALGNEIGCVSS